MTEVSREVDIISLLLSLFAFVAAALSIWCVDCNNDEEEDRLNNKSRGLASLTQAVEETVARVRKD